MNLNASYVYRSSFWGLAAGAFSLTMVLAAKAAPIQQGTNISEGQCETVSVGQYFCKINGKCYYCDTKTNPDPNKNCYKETTCAAAVTRPGFKGAMRPPIGGTIMRRGVEGDSPTGEDHVEEQAGQGDASDIQDRALKQPTPRPKPPLPPKGPTDPQMPPIGPGGTGPTTPR